MLLLLISTMLSAAVLSWDQPGKSPDLIVGYKIYWKLTSEETCPNDDIPVHAIETKDRHYDISSDETFIAGKTYEFEVTAYNASGESAPSTEKVCYRVPGKPAAPELDQLTQANQQDPITQQPYHQGDRKNETKIAFSGFGAFTKPVSSGVDSDLRLGLRHDDSQRGRVHSLLARTTSSGPDGRIASRESVRLWSNGDSDRNSGGGKELQPVKDGSGVDGRQVIQLHVDGVSNGQRDQVRVGSLERSIESGTSYKPGQPSQSSSPIAWIVLAGVALIAILLGLRKKK